MQTKNKNNSTSFTATYLRLLTGETPAPEDWEAAAELIDAGFAHGKAHRESTTGQRKIDALTGFAPTMQGRLYAAQLQEQAEARKLTRRLRNWLWALSGAVCGLLLDAAAGMLTEAMKRLLGW
ncbi:hypothetical protein [Acidovorax sp. Leaf73]|uniref:hypothetical protein n=1 Tax=Acidovorax sp. Leaf73 TaxID=2876566 RepID=UPI001E585516|nr:hypothetical protein [Acidovorax sp. Leaf73]